MQSNALKVAKVHTVYAMPEYPETSAHGVAYCVNVRGIAPNLVKHLHKDVSNPYSIIAYLLSDCKGSVWQGR
jgi:hypothetical protein